MYFITQENNDNPFSACMSLLLFPGQAVLVGEAGQVCKLPDSVQPALGGAPPLKEPGGAEDTSGQRALGVLLLDHLPSEWGCRKWSQEVLIVL